MTPDTRSPGRKPAEVSPGSLGWHLQQARLAHGMTAQDVHEATGLTTSYVAQLETGKRTNPTYDVLDRLADAYGITVPGLLMWTPDIVDLYHHAQGLLDEMAGHLKPKLRGGTP